MARAYPRPPLIPADDMPERIRIAFADRTFLSAPAVAALLEMDSKTLRKHIANGDLPGRIKGTGRVRRHWVFTIADVAKFLAPKDHGHEPISTTNGRLALLLKRRRPKGPGPTMNIKLRTSKNASDIES